MRRHDLTQIISVALFIAALVAPFHAATAGESLIEAFRWGPKFSPMWGTANVEYKQEAEFAQLQITTQGGGEAVFVSNVSAYQPIDLTGKFIKIWFRVDDRAHVGSIEFRLSSNRFSSVVVPFVMGFVADSVGIGDSGKVVAP